MLTIILCSVACHIFHFFISIGLYSFICFFVFFVFFCVFLLFLSSLLSLFLELVSVFYILSCWFFCSRERDVISGSVAYFLCYCYSVSVNVMYYVFYFLLLFFFCAICIIVV